MVRLRHAAWLLLFFLALGAAACDKEEQAPHLSSEQPASSGGKAPAERLAVSVIPEAPRVGDCLQAVVYGGKVRSLSFSWERNGEPLPELRGQKICQQGFIRGDIVSVTVTAPAEKATTSTTIGNTPPKILSVSSRPARIHRGVNLEAVPRAEDADGDMIFFRYEWWINGEVSLWDQEGALPGERFHRGDRIVVRITPYDTEEDGPTFETGEILIPNGPPGFVSSPPATFDGFDYVYDARAEDPDEDSLTYSLEIAPEGMSIDAATGRVTWSVAPELAGEHRVKVRVEDGEGLYATQEFALNVSAQDPAE